jgi:two-component system, OmpR family, alkaline phosphatase synthesis response regulator PhoP
MAHQNILVVDDEEDILELVRYNLAKEGYQVTCATTGEQALAMARASVPDLVILDLMLPGVDGLEVCKRLKRAPETQHVPVVMLTAKGEEPDIVTGLELGADDYVTKPFSPRVLVARIRTALRRKGEADSTAGFPIRVGQVAIHPGRHEAILDGRPLDLTFTEFGILCLLAERPGWVFSRYQIVNAIRGTETAVTDRSVDVHIASLRKKLGTNASHIETVRGVGYRLKAE